MFHGSMYVRVKREKIAYFIQADPSDTILELKEKLQELIEKVSEKGKDPTSTSPPCALPRRAPFAPCEGRSPAPHTHAHTHTHTHTHTLPTRI